MNVKKAIVYPALALGLMAAGGAVSLARQASASDATAVTNATSGSTRGRGAMADELAQKLNVSKDQVSTAMDQIKKEKQDERQTEINNNLDKAVKDGVITSEQKQKLLDKMTEMRKKRGQEKADMQQWQKDSGIDFSKLKGYGIGAGGRGNRG